MYLIHTTPLRLRNRLLTRARVRTSAPLRVPLVRGHFGETGNRDFCCLHCPRRQGASAAESFVAESKTVYVVYIGRTPVELTVNAELGMRDLPRLVSSSSLI